MLQKNCLGSRRGAGVLRPPPTHACISCRGRYTAPAPVHRALHICAAKADNTSAPTRYQPSNARDAIETATKLQTSGVSAEVGEAIRLYAVAMDMKPNEDEARAALYNMGCALAKQKQWTEATKCIVKAINDYGLKLTVALKDDDLRELRERREWLDALMEVRGGLSRNTKIDLRAEAKSPFRFPRLVLFGGLGVGAALGLFIIFFRLIAAVKGGEGAPPLEETLQNFGINAVAVAILGFLVYRDVQSKEKVVKVTEREEILGRLQLELGNERQLPLLRFRGQVRPVILSGSRRYVEAALKDAQPYYQDLRERGVSVVPVILDEVESAKRERKVGGVLDPEAKIRALKRELQGGSKDSSKLKGFGAKQMDGKTSDEVEPAAVEGTTPSQESTSGQAAISESDRKWRLKPYDIVEWKEWVENQKVFASLPRDAQDLYIQIQLDGTVRTSGQGIPNWVKMCNDLPPLDDVRTRFMDGIGTDV